MKITRIHLLFTFLLFVFSCSNLISCSAAYSNSGDENLRILHERTYKITAGNELKLETSSGDVLITTWDKPEVYIKVLGNDKASKEVDFKFSGTDKVVKVSAKRENAGFSLFSKGISLRFEIKVPVNFNNTVNTSGGDIRIADVNGTTGIRTSGGNISLKRVSGDLKANTSGGNIRTETARGDIYISTSGGDIDAFDFSGNLEASTSGGDIRLKGDNARIKAQTSGGDVSLIYTGDNKGIELSSSGGDIIIDVPSDFNANARLSTSGGNVSCNLTINNATRISSSKFEADLNKGGNPLIAKTSGGDIIVKKK